MGAARLLAKGWVVFCLFAGAHALRNTIAAGGWDNLPQIVLVIGCMLLFTAMGLLFAAGFGISGGPGGLAWLKSLRTHNFLPNFDDWVFLGFVLLSFLNQILFAPEHVTGGVTLALEKFIEFTIPGQRAFERGMIPCGLDGGRLFASSFAWLAAIIYLASAWSRLKLQAGLIRLQRVRQPELLGPTVLASVLGVVAVSGIQLLFVGSAYDWLPCSAFADITGAILAGLAPLMLAYVIVAALVALLASGPEHVTD